MKGHSQIQEPYIINDVIAKHCSNDIYLKLEYEFGFVALVIIERDVLVSWGERGSSQVCK